MVQRLIEAKHILELLRSSRNKAKVRQDFKRLEGLEVAVEIAERRVAQLETVKQTLRSVGTEKAS